MMPNDWAAIIFGIVGMVFALVAYNRAQRSEKLSISSDERSKRTEERSIQNDKNNALLAFEQKRQEILHNCLEVEIFNDRWAKEFSAVTAAAQIERVKDILAKSTSELASNAQEVRSIKEATRQMTVSDSPEAMRLLEQQIGILKQMKLQHLEGEKAYSEYLAKARFVINQGG